MTPRKEIGREGQLKDKWERTSCRSVQGRDSIPKWHFLNTCRGFPDVPLPQPVTDKPPL